MKHFFSILLLGIFAFNIFGYKIYFAIAEKHSDAAMVSKIEKEQFQSTDLVTYKFSAKKLPYYTNSKNYETANGEVNVSGTIMTYVKKRIYKDSIEYVCLPNIAKTNLRTARDDFFKLVNDLQNADNDPLQKKQSNKNAKPFSYDAVAFNSTESAKYILYTERNNKCYYKTEMLPSPFLTKVVPPPNVVVC